MSAPYTKLDQPLDDYAMLCRGCLAESGEMKNIIEWDLVDDFSRFTNVQVTESDNISLLLCTACEDSLDLCRRYQLQCQNSDMLLRNAVKKKMLVLPDDQDSSEPLHTSENTISYVLHDKKLVITITAPDMDSKIYLLCPHCQDNFMKQKDLKLHLMKIHKIVDFEIALQYFCSHVDCGYHINSGRNKFFQSRKYLNQHFMKVHMTKQFNCDVCSLKFPTEQGFERHLKTCNTTFLCEVCNINYKTNEKLLVHLLRKHPALHKIYKEQRKALKRSSCTEVDSKKFKMEERIDYICDSPKRSFATQTLNLEENIKNDVTLPSWQSVPGKSDSYETKTDEISTQTVFEDLLSLKSQTSEDESIFFSETVSLSDIQTQTFPIEFGLSRCNKETITSETQSPDLSIKETQTCYCLYDSPKISYRLFDSVSSSPSSLNLTSTETQTSEVKSSLNSDALLNHNSAETQTSFDEVLGKDTL